MNCQVQTSSVSNGLSSGESPNGAVKTSCDGNVRFRENSADSRVKTSCDSNGLIVENPANRPTGEVAQALAARRASYLETLAVEQQVDRTPEMRREAYELRRRVAGTTSEPAGSLEAELRDAALRRSVQVSAMLKDRIALRDRISIVAGAKWGDQDFLPPVDHSFWWARTQPHVAPDTQADFRNDGLHFFGGPKVNNYDGEMHTSFGAVASVALQPAQFPTSPSGLFLSSPHVELLGGVVAFAPDWDLIQGDGIASCNLFLRQTIFQWGFGQNGPVPVMVAEAKGNDGWHVYLKNTGYSRHLDLPGFKLIPAVTYRQDQLTPTDLWAEIEVRFDIYLNCTGALLWCDPEAVVRTFQWAPTPLP